MYELMALVIGIIIFILTVFMAREAYRDGLESWSDDKKKAKEKARDQAGGVLIGGTMAAILCGIIWPVVLIFGILAGIGYVFWKFFVKWAEKGE